MIDINFLDKNYSPVFEKIEKFRYDNPFKVDQNMKEKIIKLYMI